MNKLEQRVQELEDKLDKLVTCIEEMVKQNIKEQKELNRRQMELAEKILAKYESGNIE